MEHFDGFLRGVLEANGEPRTLEQQLMPRAAFMRTDAVRKSQFLRFDSTKIFLAAAGYNFKCIAAWLRDYLRQLIAALLLNSIVNPTQCRWCSQGTTYFPLRI
jgi:hypothetical protein